MTRPISTNENNVDSRSTLEQFFLKTGKASEAVAHDLGIDRIIKSTVKKTSMLATGAATVAGSSLLFGHTITPALTNFVRQSDQQLDFLKTIPFVGDLVHEVLGKAGALGALSVAAPLLGLVATLVESNGRASDRLCWLASHMALGFAASPVWLLPASQAMGLLPALGLSAACVLGASLVLNERVDAGRTTVKMLITGVSLVVAGAPLPAQLAAGVPMAAAATFGVLVLGAGACVMAAYMVSTSWAALNNESTAELRSTKVSSSLSDFRLNLPNEKDPTVHCASEELLNNVAYMRRALSSGARLGVETILLSGPPGTGKTAISKSIAHALGADAHIIMPSKILSEENPANELRKLFEQARLTQKKLVFFFDDAESLFGNRNDAVNASVNMDQRRLITTTLNDCIQGVEVSDSPLTLVILSTNDRNHLDDSLLSRFAMCDIEVPLPARDSLPTIFKSVMKTAVASLPRELRNDGLTLSDALINKVLAQFEAKHVSPSGRDLRNLCGRACKRFVAVNSQVHHQAFGLRQSFETFKSKESIDQCFAAVVPEEIDRLRANQLRNNRLRAAR